VTGLFLEDLSVGQSAELDREVREADLVSFAAVTGDENPLHLDEAYAAKTPFKGRIAHGMLSAGYISAVIAMRLPGPGSIYVSQSLKFLRPVRIGDLVKARVEIAAIDADRGWVTLHTTCLVGRREVVKGEAVIVVPRKPV
jgi:3-hydroxybutyryl-CoA dehydratase